MKRGLLCSVQSPGMAPGSLVTSHGPVLGHNAGAGWSWTGMKGLSKSRGWLVPAAEHRPCNHPASCSASSEIHSSGCGREALPYLPPPLSLCLEYWWSPSLPAAGCLEPADTRRLCKRIKWGTGVSPALSWEDLSSGARRSGWEMYFFLLPHSCRAVSQYTDLRLWWGCCLQTVPVLDVPRSGNGWGAAWLGAAPGLAPGVTVSFNLGSGCTVRCTLVLRYWLTAAAWPCWPGAVAGWGSPVSLTSPQHPASDGGGFSFRL